MIDFHCHLDLYKNPEEVRAGIEERAMYVLAVTTTPKAWDGSRRLVGDAKYIRLALGLHPELAAKRQSEMPLFESLLLQTKYVGEVGIDGSPDHADSLGIQTEVFDSILRACKSAGGRVLSIHSRGAATKVIDCWEKHSGVGKAVLHWFSGTNRELDRARDAGFWFSVGPAMLQSQKGRQIIASIPRERILTETDGPLSAPTMNPWEVARVESHLSELWSEPSGSVTRQLRQNLKTLLTE